MLFRFLIVVGYLLVMLSTGFFFRRASSRNTVVPRVLLFRTMAASYFSAFTIFGLSGAGYRIGCGLRALAAGGVGGGGTREALVP